MTDIALNFSAETESVKGLVEALNSVKGAAKNANESNLKALRDAIKGLGLSSKEELQKMVAGFKTSFETLNETIRANKVTSVVDLAAVQENLNNMVLATSTAEHQRTLIAVEEAARRQTAEAAAARNTLDIVKKNETAKVAAIKSGRLSLGDAGRMIADLASEARKFAVDSSRTWAGLTSNQISSSDKYLNSVHSLRMALKAAYEGMALDLAKVNLGSPAARLGATNTEGTGAAFVASLVRESESIKNGFNEIYLKTKEGSALALSAMREYYAQVAAQAAVGQQIRANRELLAATSERISMGSFTSEDALAKTRELYALEQQIRANRELLATTSARISIGSFTSEDALAKTRELYALEQQIRANRELLATTSARISMGSFTSEDALAKTRELYALEQQIRANRELLATTSARISMGSFTGEDALAKTRELYALEQQIRANRELLATTSARISIGSFTSEDALAKTRELYALEQQIRANRELLATTSARISIGSFTSEDALAKTRELYALEQQIRANRELLATTSARISMGSFTSEDALAKTRELYALEQQIRANRELLATTSARISMGSFTSEDALAKTRELYALEQQIRANRELLATTSARISMGSFTSEDALAKTRELYALEQQIRANRELLATTSARISMGSFTSEDALAKTRELYALEQQIRANRELLATTSARISMGSFTSEDALTRTRELYSLEQQIRANRELLATTSARISMGSFTSEDALAKTRELYTIEQQIARNRELMAVSASSQTRSLTTQITEQERSQHMLQAMRDQYLSAGATSNYTSSSFAPVTAVDAKSTPINPVHPQAIRDTVALNAATVSLTGSHKAMNDGLRGLVQSLGMYSSTMSAIIPMMAGMAIGAGLKHMLDQGRDLEYQMTFIAKLTEGATISVEQFSKAMEGSQLTTKEGAQGLRALAQAGLSAEDALIALPNVMNLAVVGEMQLGAAALVATGVMHAFNLQMTDMGHIIDVMTKAAAISNTSVEGMATAMKTASVVSDQFGIGLEEVSAGLVVMAKRNIEGTSGGTAMKNFITNLASTTPVAAARMKQLGIEVYDTEGNLKKMSQIIPELATAFVGLNEKTKNEALKDLFNERGRRAAAAMIKDVQLYGETVARLSNESQGFAANVVRGLDHTVTGQIKATANALSISFDEAFAHTSNAWSNLIAQFTDAAKSSGLRTFVEDVAKATITLVDNLGKLTVAAAAIGVAVLAWQTYGAAVLAAEAASVAAGITTAAVTVSLEAQAAAAAQAATATGVFSAVLARIAWPVAIVAGLWAAFQALSSNVDAATEAQKRYAREGEETISKLDALIAKTNEESAALRLQTREHINLAEAVRRVRREKGLSADGKDQGQSNLIAAANKLAEAQDKYKTAFNTKWTAHKEGVELKEATDNYFAAAAAANEMAKQAPAIAIKQQAADMELGAKAISAATQANAQILRDKVVEGQNFLVELKKKNPKDPKIGQVESAIADLERLDKGLALVGETVANNVKITKDGALAPEVLQTMKETADLAKGGAKELDKFFVALDKPASGFDKGPRSPHVERVKLETTNIAAEMAKRDKLVLDSDKTTAANSKAVLDAQLAANLITKSRYAAEVQYLEEQSTAATIADINKQQDARVEAYKVADAEILKVQAEFNKRNSKNPTAIADNDRAIAKARADNANKYGTESLAATYAIMALQDKARTDTEVAEAKHKEELRKIDKDFSDWQVTEAALKDKNLRTLKAAADARDAATPMQSAVLAAESVEYERLIANAEKYDTTIQELTDTTSKFVDLRGKGSAKEQAIAELEFKAHEKELALLDKYTDRKSRLTGVIPIEVKFKGSQAADEFIRIEVARVRTGLTEAIMNAGKDGGKGLREFIEAELVSKPFKIIVNAVLNPITEGIAQGIMGQAAEAGVGGTGEISSVASVLQGASLAASTFGSTLAATAKGVALSGATVSSTMTVGAKMLAAGEIAGGAGMIAGAALPPLLVAAAVAKAVELIGGIGGSRYIGTSITGGKGEDGFSWGTRRTFEQRTGGWGVVSGETTRNADYPAIDPAIGKYLTAVGENVVTNVKGWAQAIGLSVDAIDGYNKQIEVALSEGMTTDELKAAFGKAFAGFADTMVADVFGDQLLPLSQDGETLGQTLMRLGIDLATVNSILSGFDKPLFDISLSGAAAAEELLDSVGGLDKLKGLATDLVTVNDNLAKLGLPLFDVSVASAQAAQGMLTATNAAVEALDAANKLEASYASFAKNLSKDPDTTQVASLKAIFDRAMSGVTDYIPSLKGKSLSSITYDDYAGFNEPQRAKLDAAAIAFKDLQTAIDSAAKTAESAAKTAKDAADTAAKAYSDALQSVQDDTQAVLAQTSDIGKTEFQKQIAQIQRDGVKKQVELDKLSTASNKAAEEYADLTKAAADAAKTVNTLSDTFSTVSSGARTLGTTASKMIADIAAALAKAGVKTPEQNQAQALAMTVVQPGKGFATGGRIVGPGTGTSDGVPMWGSNGEWVIQDASVAYYGEDFMDAVNQRKLPKTVFRAEGGPVGPGGSGNSAKGWVDQWVGALNWSVETMATSAATLQNWAVDNGLSAADLKAFGYSLDNFSTETKALIQANISPGTWDWANGAMSEPGGQPYTPTGGTVTTSTQGATGGSSVVEENTAAKLAAAYEAQRVSMLGLYKATETQTEANNALAAAGYDVSGLSADGIKKYFAGLLDAAKPIYNEDGTIKEFSADAIKAINQIDKLGGSIGTLTKVAEDRQNWQDKLDVLTGKTTEQALSRQKELAGTTDTATLKIIEQVHAQEDLAKATAALKTYTDAYASLNVELVSAMGDKSQAYAVQKAIDLADVYRDQTPATAALISKQYDLNAARKEEIELLNSAKTRLENYTNAGASKGVELLRLQGDTAGADKAQEAIDLGDVFKSTSDAIALLATEGLTPLDKAAIQATIQTNDLTIAQYARNRALDNEIETLKRYKAMSESATSALDNTANSVTNSRIGLLTAQGNTAGAAALQRELDITPYTKAIKDAQTELEKATTATEKSTLADVIAKNTQAIANYDLSKSLDKEAESARAAREAANALAQAYKGLQDQILQANIELMKASGKTAEADEAAMALALRDHAGDENYASLYRELLTIQKLTEARNQLNSMEDSAQQKQIALLRAYGQNGVANAMERAAAIKEVTAPAEAAKAEIARSNIGFRDFAISKGIMWLEGMGVNNVLKSLDSDNSYENRKRMADVNSPNNPQLYLSGYELSDGYTAQGGDWVQSGYELLQEYVAIGRTDSQKKNLQGVVDTAASITAAYDKNKALEAELKIIELQDEAYKQNLDAQKSLTDAQKAYADVLKSTIGTMRDFLKTLDGAATPTQNLSQARADFRNVSQKVASGDTSAYKDLTPAARTFLDLSKNYSKSLVDYQRDEARVRTTLNAVITANQRELDKLPKEISAAADPTKDAWLKLQEATAKEADTSIMLTALGVDSAASKRRLRTAEESLSDRYIEAVYLLDEAKKTPLLKAFNDAIAAKANSAELPEYTAFNLGDIWGTKIAGVLPATRMTNADWNALIATKFPGLLKSDLVVPMTPDVLTGLIRGVMPAQLTADNLVNTPANVSSLVSTKIGEILPSDFAGAKFNAQQMMQTAINTAMAAITPARPVAPDLSTTHTNTVQDQGLSGGTSGTGTTDWASLSASEAAKRLGISESAANQPHYLSAILQTYTAPAEYAYQKTFGDGIDQKIADLKAYGKSRGYPGFAVGTNYVPKDMLAQIHEGEAIIPAPFNPAKYGRDSGNTALVEKIQELTAKVEVLTQKLEAGQDAIAANTGKATRLLAKFDIDGMPKTRT